MQITDLRADILESINAYLIEEIAAFESADNDNVLIVTAADGNRYKLTIEKL